MEFIRLSVALMLFLLVAPVMATGEEVGQGSGDIDRLVDVLAAGGPDSYDAGEQLSRIGPSALPAMLDALKTGRNTAGILTAIGLLRDSRAIGTLEGYLCGRDAALSGAAASALITYGDAAVEELSKLLKDPACGARAVDVMRYAQPSSDSVKLMMGLTNSADGGERGGAVLLLGLWKVPESEETLKKLMTDNDPMVRRMAIDGYEQLHVDSPSGYDKNLLISLLKDEDPYVRRRAADLLINFPDEDTVTALLRVIKEDTDQTVRRYAIIGLERSTDPRIILPLIGIVQDEKSTDELVIQAVYMLGVLKAREAVPYIVGIFERGYVENTDIQQESFIALTEMGEPVDLKQFLPYLKVGPPHHESLEQLLSLIETLGKPDDKEVIDALEKFQAGLDNEMRVARVQRVLDRLK